MSCINRVCTKTAAFCCFALFVAIPARAWAGEDRLVYPETKQVDQIDTLHGVKVSDPYRWLEQDVRNTKDVADWVAAENKLTFGYLEAIPQREKIRKRLTELWNFAVYAGARKEGGRYYFLKNDGLQNQAVLYRLDTLDGEPKVLIDPNTWSKDGTIALQLPEGLSFSDDGKYLAYARAEAGSDWATWYVMEIESGKILNLHDRNDLGELLANLLDNLVIAEDDDGHTRKFRVLGAPDNQ